MEENLFYKVTEGSRSTNRDKAKSKSFRNEHRVTPTRPDTKNTLEPSVIVVNSSVPTAKRHESINCEVRLKDCNDSVRLLDSVNRVRLLHQRPSVSSSSSRLWCKIASDENILSTVSTVLAGGCKPGDFVVDVLRGQANATDLRTPKMRAMNLSDADDETREKFSAEGVGTRDTAIIRKPAPMKTRLQVLLRMKLLFLARFLSVLWSDAQNLKSLALTVKQTSASVNHLLADYRAELEFYRKELQLHHAALLDRKEQIMTISNTSSNGTFIWHIHKVEQRFKEAVSGAKPSFFSPVFRVLPYGYKAAMRIYLNGDTLGKNAYVSLFISLLKSPTDPILKWPFCCKITILVLDRNSKAHLIDAFKPDINNVSFEKPTTNMNLASGSSFFMPIEVLLWKGPRLFDYIVEDTLTLKIIVDVSDLSIATASVSTL